MSKRPLINDKNYNESIFTKKQESLEEPALKKFKKEEEGEICAICQEEINDGRPLKYCDSQVPSHTPTKDNPRAHPHVFHKECIDHWLSLNDNNNNSCPLCGARVLCLDADKYRTEFQEEGKGVEPIYNPNPDNYNPDDIESDDEDMDEEPTDQEGNPIDINVWNEQHPQGPWWRIISCESTSVHCPGDNLDEGKNFQWFLSHEPQAVEITDRARSSGWESIDGKKVCPACAADPDALDYCEQCGEGYLFPGEHLTHVDDELLCDGCLEGGGARGRFQGGRRRKTKRKRRRRKTKRRPGKRRRRRRRTRH